VTLERINIEGCTQKQRGRKVSKNEWQREKKVETRNKKEQVGAPTVPSAVI
jgi:hypothetical protein